MTSTADERVLITYVCKKPHILAEAVATEHGIRLDVKRTPYWRGEQGRPVIKAPAEPEQRNSFSVFLSELEREPFGPLVMACDCNREFTLMPQEIREHRESGRARVVLDPTA